jgi:hypothetical protein
MSDDATTISGIVIPSTDPAFLTVVVEMHIPLGIACVVMGASAMLSRKGRGRHSTLRPPSGARGRSLGASTSLAELGQAAYIGDQPVL